MQKKFEKVNGITLISLVITIVIMLILAGVTLKLVIGNNGLFTKSKASIEASKQSSAKEKLDMLLSEYGIDRVDTDKTLEAFFNEKKASKEIDNVTNNNDGTLTVVIDGYAFTVNDDGTVTSEGTVTDRTGIKVGDYIEYNPDTVEGYTKLIKGNTGADTDIASFEQEKLSWKVLRIYPNGSMDIIGCPTNKKVTFNTDVGYDNAVYLLNDLCKNLYSHGNLKARSVKAEDFESWLTSNAKNERKNYISCGGIQYEKTKMYTSFNSYFPRLYAYENGSGINTLDLKTNGINQSAITAEGFEMPSTVRYGEAMDKGLTVTQTYSPIEDLNTDYIGDGAKALYDETRYWVATRFVDCGSDYAYFGLYFGSNCLGQACNIFRSTTYVDSSTYSVRPVVTLGTNVKIQVSETASTNANTPHKITEY